MRLQFYPKSTLLKQVSKPVFSFIVLFILFQSSVLAGSGIYQTYAIINKGSFNEYYAGGINSQSKPPFNGLNFGSFCPGSTLLLNGGEVLTFKNSGSNVTGANIFYRIYPTGSPSGSFIQIDLPFSCEYPAGGCEGTFGSGDQKWTRFDHKVNLLSGLIAGNYTLEVYWNATTSSDGIHFDSDFGNNFKATFTVLPSALSASVTPVTCFGGNNGAINLTTTCVSGLPSVTLSVTENFNTLAASGTNSWTDGTTISNWFTQQYSITSPGSFTTYTASTGTATTGALYSFGIASTNAPLTDRAIGTIASGGTNTILGARRITNTTTQTLSSITVTYTGEQWRMGSNIIPQSLVFDYQIGATSITAGTWTPVTALNFTSLINNATTAIALDGNAPANRSVRTATFAISLAPGQSIWLRWTDMNDGGNDHGLAIDDLKVTLSSPGGVGYSWTSPNGFTSTNEDISGLAAGDYTVTVTGGNGTATATYTVGQPTAITASLGSQVNVSCNGGSNGSVVINASGGTGTLVITPAQTGLSAGNYTFTVTDKNNCTATVPVTITQPAALVLSETHTNVLCNGGSNGSVNLSVSGGTSPYTYAWTGAGVNATAQNQSGLAAGMYSVTVTDANSCTATTSVTITEPTAFQLSGTKVDVNCNGGNNGSVNLSVSGGTPFASISYSQNFNTLLSTGTSNTWTDNSTIQSWYTNRITYIASTGTLTNGGLYSFGTTSDDRSLGSIASNTSGNILGAVRVTNTTGQTLTSITINYTGEQWRNSGNAIAHRLDFSFAINATDESIGTYSDVDALDFTGPVSGGSTGSLDGNLSENKALISSTFAISLAPGESIWLRWTDANDGGDDHGLSIDDLSVTLTTGTSTPYSYLWSNGATTEDISGLTAGSYSVTVTDANGCTSQKEVTITEPIAVTVSASSTNVSCNGAADGTITASGSAGSTITINGSAPAATYGPGTYTVTATAPNGNNNGVCTASTTVTITEPIAVTVSASSTNVSCNGAADGTITASGSAGSTITINGSAPAATYGSGTYTVTATAPNGNNNGVCTASTTVTITQPDDLTASSTAPALVCPDGTVIVTVTASGGTASYTGTGNFVRGAGTHNFTVKDANGCSASTTITIAATNVAPANISFTPSTIDPVAIGTEVTLKVNYTDNNVTRGTVNWDDGLGEQTISTSLATPITLSRTYTTPGVYSVTITLTDECGLTTSLKYDYVVVYDPSGGFVTGGGWINSPAGAYVADGTLTGKANFGFVAKYKKGTNVPDGNTEFQFHAGNFNFKSSAYDAGWLVISGYKATFRGKGTVNGVGDYGFLVSTIDGQKTGGGGFDKFRIKIWDKNNGNTLVYDNNMGLDENGLPTTAISGGSIVIHEVKKAGTKIDQNIMVDQILDLPVAFKVRVFGNPAVTSFRMVLESGIVNEAVTVKVVDVNGRLIEVKQNLNANQVFELGNQYKQGIYFAEVIQGTQRKVVKLIKIAQD